MANWPGNKTSGQPDVSAHLTCGRQKIIAYKNGQVCKDLTERAGQDHTPQVSNWFNLPLHLSYSFCFSSYTHTLPVPVVEDIYYVLKLSLRVNNYNLLLL